MSDSQIDELCEDNQIYVKSNLEDINKKIESIAIEVKKVFDEERSGHDWWHMHRVWKMVKKIALIEKADVDMFVLEVAALLHDIDDWKLVKEGNGLGLDKALLIMKNCGVPGQDIDKVMKIIPEISYSKGNRKLSDEKNNLRNEIMIIRDADWLDAIGAIGIARVFTYGGCTNKLIYNPNIKPIKYKYDTKKVVNLKDRNNEDTVMKISKTSINHFYEKLLKLSGIMNTEIAKQVARERHLFMKRYLRKFLNEWRQEKLNFLKNEFKLRKPGHDWWNSYRVWNLARIIAESDNISLIEDGTPFLDAEKLTEIGAIGIARLFANGGSSKYLIYDPEVKYNDDESCEEYVSKAKTSINYLSDRMLKLKDEIKTEKAKHIAKDRHLFMEEYLERFYLELNMKDIDKLRV